MSTLTHAKPEWQAQDPQALRAAQRLLEACRDPRDMAQEVIAAVSRNAKWRGAQCLNLIAAEAPTSRAVRNLLSAEIGTRAAEGPNGPTQGGFVGTRAMDEVAALCVELLKRALRTDFAEHRLCAGMIGNLAVYTALARPGDTVMAIPPTLGGHSSHRRDGLAGVRGLRVVDLPFTPDLDVDLVSFRRVAERERPRLVALGLSMTLFPLPCRELAEIIAPWGGKLFFDGAHQLGLIACGQFQDPLREGACVLTGSGGTTWSGPQSGIMAWNDPQLTAPLAQAVFPTLTATHQVNRVAALALSAAELLAYGEAYMAQVVKNAQALGRALERCGIPVLGGSRGYTRTHQVIADVRTLGGGLEAAQRLAQSNIIGDKILLPGDGPEPWNQANGLRLGTVEVTRLGMREAHMQEIAAFIARVLVHREPAGDVAKEIATFRLRFQTLYYCFETGLPAA